MKIELWDRGIRTHLGTIDDHKGCPAVLMVHYSDGIVKPSVVDYVSDGVATFREVIWESLHVTFPQLYRGNIKPFEILKKNAK